jgi:serine/threonine protein kinase
MAPEMLSKREEAKNKNKNNYDTKCEVYSFGILLWEIAECKTPYSQFEDIEDVTNKVIIGYRESFTEGSDIPKKYQELVNKAVDQDPDLQPTFAKMLVELEDIFKKYNPIRGLSSLIENAIREKLIKYIKWEELTDISKIGSGHFGSVYKARWSNINDYVVLKKLYDSNDIQEDALQHEIEMLNRAHACKNIIRFIGITRGTVYN